MARFEIRALLPGDEEQLHRVARHLNSVNLPNDRERIEEIVDTSYKSFAGIISAKAEREYVFVLFDRQEEKIIGTSMILAQLGRRGAPYIYFDVIDEERYSGTIDKHFHHTILKIGYSYQGPTEIGGLVMDPAYRKSSERLGTMISYVRFLYIGAHRELFRDEIVAELLPPLEPDGTSHLWEALGRKFTDMSYAEADLLSKKNKEFIKGLFPEGVIHASLLPRDAQDVIGKVGAQTKGVEKLLRRIGFRYAHRVDPFDGGPHFSAAPDEIAPVRDTRRTTETRELTASDTRQRGLVAVELDVPPFFRAIPSEMSVPPRADDAIALSSEAIQALELRPGREVIVLPFS
ncbi:MAG: arginine N-succinyltransferase [Polyangiaceae bacterium]|jgi:arginine N-succinyltransferase|nr:arginine N-succinyltransferase [Polyangiaceae bacterium]